MSRLDQLHGHFDVIIIGGGIIGAGIARDAALRGWSVAVIDRADFGGGTTSGSTRLIHGGLRYLEMLDFRLVRMDLREREILLRNAPHLVKPLEFLVPIYDRSLFYRVKLRAGMMLYDTLSYDKSLPNHRFIGASEAHRIEPGLDTRGLQGAALYYDAQVNSPERLAVENLVDAAAHGAVVLNYVEAVAAVYDDDAVTGVRVRDTEIGEEKDVRARVVVNASGPWFDRVASKLGERTPPRIRTTKGIHIACEPVAHNANVLFAKDGRLFFVIPWLGYSWVGTTDTDFNDDPANVQATRADIEYLVNSASVFFPQLSKAHLFWTNAGVRALVRQPGSESSVSRMHRIDTNTPGLVSVLGGKITGYRAIAEEAADTVGGLLKSTARSTTAEAPLEPPDLRPILAADPQNAQLLTPGSPDTVAHVIHGVRNEFCRRVSDFLLRRSLAGFSRDQGRAAAPAVARWMAQELGWSQERQLQEIREYEGSHSEVLL